MGETQHIELKVGRWTAQGEHRGNVVTLPIEEDLGAWTDYSLATRDSWNDRGITYRIFRLPGNRYCVSIWEWSNWADEASWVSLDPYPTAAYGLSEEQARKRYPRAFAALGYPNTIMVED